MPLRCAPWLGGTGRRGEAQPHEAEAGLHGGRNAPWDLPMDEVGAPALAVSPQIQASFFLGSLSLEVHEALALEGLGLLHTALACDKLVGARLAQVA